MIIKSFLLKKKPFERLKHSFSRTSPHFFYMLFELNENPKVIQQLLGHREVKTTIGVYNNVNSDYIREGTSRLNDKLNKNEMLRVQNIEQEKEKQKQEDSVKEMSDEEMDDILERLLSVRQERKKKRERDFEM